LNRNLVYNQVTLVESGALGGLVELRELY
jgi:hypothetical protein